MKITALVENTSCCSLPVEHGLSLYIETSAHGSETTEHNPNAPETDAFHAEATSGTTKILFDMGQGTLFAENARALGVSIEEVDLAVISHGHYDHGGGLSTFLQLNHKAPVYIHSRAFEPHYSLKPSGYKYIGLNPILQQNPRLLHCNNITAIKSNSHNHISNSRNHITNSYKHTNNSHNHITNSYKHTNNLHNLITNSYIHINSYIPSIYNAETFLLFSEVTGNCCNPPGNKLLFSQASPSDLYPTQQKPFAHEQNSLNNDSFAHEQSLLIREGEKLVLFAGCAHAGIINIMRKAEQIAGSPPTHVFAGMHLATSSSLIPSGNIQNSQTTKPTENSTVAKVSSTTDTNTKDVASQQFIFITKLTRELQSYQNTKYYTMHCTGTEQYKMLRQIMGNQISYLSAGETVTI